MEMVQIQIPEVRKIRPCSALGTPNVNPGLKTYDAIGDCLFYKKDYATMFESP